MKLNIINTTNFKNSSSSLYPDSDKQLKTNSEIQIPEQMDFYTFRKTALFNTFNPDNQYYFDISELDERTLANNIKVCFDGADINKKVSAKMKIIPLDNDSIEPLELSILAKMLDVNTQNKNKETAFGSEFPELFFSFYSLEPNDTLKILNDSVEILLNPIFDEETLKKAKEEEKKYFDSSKDSLYSLANDYIFNKNRPVNNEDIDKITLDDIKKLYNSILSNSQVKFIVSAPKGFLNKENKDTISDTLSKIYIMDPFCENYYEESLILLNENKTFKQKSLDGISKYGKIFTYKKDSDLKSEVALEVLYRLFSKSIEENYSPETDLGSFGSYGLISYTLLASDKETSADILQEKLNQTIQNFIDGNISDKALYEAKQFTKARKIKKYKMRDFENDFLFNHYTDSDNTLKSYLDTLDKITPDDIQQAAKKYLSGNYIEVIEE